MHDFEFKGAAEMPRPYDPKDYGLPVWRDEDHLLPEAVADLFYINMNEQQ